MFPHDRIVEQLYAVLRVETAAKKIEVMIFSFPNNWDGWRNIKKHWAFQQQNWWRPPLKIFVEVTSPSKITCWLDVLLCLLVSPKALGYLYQSIREVKELFLTFWKHPPPLPLGGQQAWKRGNLFLGICGSPEKAFVSAQNAQNVEKPKSIEAQAGKGSCSAAPAAEDHRSRSTHRLRTSSVQLRPWPELHVSCNWMGVIMDCLLVFFWQTNKIMDRPASLCWEGVALGWRENVPRPRSRGGEALHKEHNGALHGLHREHSSGGGHHVTGSPSENQQPASLRIDSGLNSLEYWDYSVELECLSGPEGKIDQLPIRTGRNQMSACTECRRGIELHV